MNSYLSDRTALLLVDPYNTFSARAGSSGCGSKRSRRKNISSIICPGLVAAARAAKIQIFIVPHHRWEPGDYAKWRHPNPSQIASGERQTFAKGSWGGEWHRDFGPQEGDVIIKEHGPRAASPTPISTNGSNSMASKTSS
ncbi:MAG: isochorismatase family protein [Candidatus Binatia bacterium]